MTGDEIMNKVTACYGMTLQSFVLAFALLVIWSNAALAQCTLVYEDNSAYVLNTSKTTNYWYRVLTRSNINDVGSKKEGTLRPGQRKSVGRININKKIHITFKVGVCRKI